MNDAAAQHTVLILDDEKNVRETIKMVLAQEGMLAITAHDASSAMRILQAQIIDALVLDICLADFDGIAFFRKLQAEGYAIPTVFISGNATLSQAAEAVRTGAFDFIEKPFSAEKIAVTVKRCIEHAAMQDRLRIYEGEHQASDIVGVSSLIRQLLVDIQRVAATNASVLIHGESGVGKELVAASVHQHSSRNKQPFIKVNCSAIPENLVESELFGYEKGAFSGAVVARKGLFEMANRGTIFLDEMADLSLSAQAKILRVLQSGEIQKLGSQLSLKVDVRVVSATHKNLKQCVTDGLFREDLFYRLNVVPIKVPSLRERVEDIPLLVYFLIRAISKKNNLKEKPIDEDVLTEFKRYNWPGNVRELQNVLERMLIMSNEHITLDNVPDEILIAAEESLQSQETTLRSFRNNAERDYIVITLKRVNGNITKAATELGVSRTYLHRRLGMLSITKKEVL